LSINIQQRKKAARKTVRARKEREKSEKHSLWAKKAIVTINESEKRCMRELARRFGVSEEQVFHHHGIPDLMVICRDGKIAFFEVKPAKGSPERRLLNNYQKEAVERLLKLGLEVYIVNYQKRGKYYDYEEPIRLYADNLKKYCFS